MNFLHFFYISTHRGTLLKLIFMFTYDADDADGVDGVDGADADEDDYCDCDDVHAAYEQNWAECRLTKIASIWCLI